VDDVAAIQLRLIAEIGEAMRQAGASWWLYGGWAMDFHAGCVTRAHSDIEFFVRIEHAEAAKAALVARGFLAPPGLHPDEGQPFLKDGVEAGMWFLERRSDGTDAVPGRWADWPFVAGSFDGAPGRIGDIEAPVMSIEGLLDMKGNFAAHPHGAPLREKDASDIALLLEMLERFPSEP
jgi:hypothetical protein